jgi:hypothetical protein
MAELTALKEALYARVNTLTDDEDFLDELGTHGDVEARFFEDATAWLDANLSSAQKSNLEATGWTLDEVAGETMTGSDVRQTFPNLGDVIDNIVDALVDDMDVDVELQTIADEYDDDVQSYVHDTIGVVDVMGVAVSLVANGTLHTGVDPRYPVTEYISELN